MIRLFLVLNFLWVSGSQASTPTGCANPSAPVQAPAFYQTLCSPAPNKKLPSTGTEKVVSILYSKSSRSASSWNFSLEDWTAFLQEHRQAEKLALNPGPVADRVHELEKKVTPAELSRFAEFLVRIGACADGELAEQFASTIARVAAANPVLFLRSVSVEQKNFENRKKEACAKKIADTYQAPSLTASVLSTLKSEWEDSQAPASIVQAVSREKDLKKDPNLAPLMSYILGDAK
jgi:hypothetical protein